MLNVIVLMGRLCSDPELKHTPSNKPVTSFRIAVDRPYKDDAGSTPTDFINVVAWNQTAEFVSKYFSKGAMIALEGSLQMRQYETKDGNKATVYEVLAQSVSFTGEDRR